MLSIIAAKFSTPTLFDGFEDGFFPHGVLAKQESPSPHSAFDPLGHGLASAQLSTNAAQLDPQKYFDATSSTLSVTALLLGFSPINGVQIVGDGDFPGDVPLLIDGLLPLQGVPLKHDIDFFGHSLESPDGHGIAFSQSI
jgi:hypothetical protein